MDYLVYAKEKLRKEKLTKKSNHLKVSVEEDLEISDRLLPMLSDWRAEERNEWIRIGWVLFTIGDGSFQAQEQWLDFSARCEDKFDEGNCIHEWDKMFKKDFTIGTLRYYAEMDNPQMYNEFKKERKEKSIIEALDGSHNDIAKLLFEDHGIHFTCSSIRDKSWYQFRDHWWEEIEEGVFLREKISKEVVDIYAKRGAQLWTEKSTEKDKERLENLNKRVKSYEKMIANLKSSPYKT